jgi:hypothetical protein
LTHQPLTPILHFLETEFLSIFTLHGLTKNRNETVLAMEKRIAYYTLTERGAFWPENIAKLYKNELSKYGVMYFDEDSNKEAEFVKLTSELGIDTSRKTITKCTGKDLYHHPFHYLSVQVDRDYQEKDEFMDLTSACGGDGQILCRIGGKQKRKIVIDPKKSKQLDIMTKPNWFKPKIIIISRRLKELMETMDFSGYDLVPCLAAGREYSQTDVNYDSQNINVEEQASYFQLIITAEILNPPTTGNIRVFSQCQRCKTVYGFDSDATPLFRSEDLNTTDFQIFSTYKSDKAGKFRIAGEIPIISADVLRLLIENKISGLTSYLTDPPVRHGIVEIR